MVVMVYMPFFSNNCFPSCFFQMQINILSVYLVGKTKQNKKTMHNVL